MNCTFSVIILLSSFNIYKLCVSFNLEPVWKRHNLRRCQKAGSGVAHVLLNQPLKMVQESKKECVAFIFEQNLLLNDKYLEFSLCFSSFLLLYKVRLFNFLSNLKSTFCWKCPLPLYSLLLNWFVILVIIFCIEYLWIIFLQSTYFS